MFIYVIYKSPRPWKVSVAEAKDRPPKLIKAAEKGEVVTICPRGEPVADIVRTTSYHEGRRKKAKILQLKGRNLDLRSRLLEAYEQRGVDALFEGHDE